MVAAAYFERTGDLALLEELWPHLERALAWIDGPGDPDGDGFVEYLRRSPNGLTNQGWKDSRDSIMHADGSLAEGPIALCEVQAYVYGARAGLARVASRLGHHARAEQLAAAAERMRKEFAEAFWCDDLGTYALALDGAKRPCQVRTSNPGHCLFAGLPREDRALRTAETLVASDSFSGWGVRTVSSREVFFNPMSYHNGSVWPHDSALCVAGIARYGHRDGAVQLMRSAFEAAAHFDMRLPELFCGFPRVQGAPPIAYPVACMPQAWAAGAPFMLLQACLGIEIDGLRGEIVVDRPRLPLGIDEVRVLDVELGGNRLDLLFRRVGSRVGMFVEGKGDHVPPVRLRN
jgi:glycogen debranching enzyme